MAGQDQRLTLSFKKTSWKQLRPALIQAAGC